MLTVYIADDSVVVRGKLKEAIEEKGSIKVIGESGDAGLAIVEIRRLDPQAVIIDIRMPGGGGLPILKDIKARNPNRIALILTSFPYPQYRQIYLEAGADYFFDKAKDIPQMINTLVELAHQSIALGNIKNRGQT
jgi:two-component system, NarL family, invasion response regulator UvrY